MEIVIKNRESEKRRLRDALDAFGGAHQVPNAVLLKVDLALEELLTNILSYGYGDTAEHEIVIRLEIAGGAFQVTIVDDGLPFDPTQRPPPDTTLPLEEKPIGGLGIHLARSSVDEMRYAREGGRNILKLAKRL